MKKRRFATFIALLLVSLFFMTPANAKAKGIFEHQDTTVPADQKVDDVLVIGGDATIFGTVNKSVIIFNGNLTLKESAQINGFVLVVGGNVQQEQGAVVKDDIISFSFDHATKNSLLIGGGLVLGTWLLQLAVSVLFIALPVITVFFSKRRFRSLVERARQSFGKLMYAGFFSSLILIALITLLFITIIGIPVAFLILAFVGLSFVVGMSVLSIWFGEKVQGILGQAEWLIALTGSILLVSLMNVPFIGALLFIGVLIFSIGIMTLWVLEKIKRPVSK